MCYRLSGKRSHANRSVRRATDTIRAEVYAPVLFPTMRSVQAAEHDFPAIERAVGAEGATYFFFNLIFPTAGNI